ncbi:MAG: hypothetical protein U0840_11390 [Gemmataceae bacterium]
MTPVRIKLYGLVWMTRRRYVQQLVTACGLAVLFLGVWWWQWPVVRTRFDGADSPALARFLLVMDHVPWVLAGVVVLQLIEAFFVLRVFARREKAST